MRAAAGLAVLVLVGCPGDDPDCRETSDVVGVRFVDEAEARGIDLEYAPEQEIGACPVTPSGVAAVDLDGDGDVDLSFGRLDGFPVLFENDGGHFTRRAAEPSFGAADGRHVSPHHVADLDGDGLNDILLVHTPGPLLFFRNLGGFAFADAEVLWAPEGWPRDCHTSIVLGDADGDGDLDIVLPGIDPVPSLDWVQPTVVPDEGSPDLVLENVGGAFVERVTLTTATGPGLSLGGVFSDRDNDGDLDLLLGSDRVFDLPPQPWYRNDGDWTFVDDAPALQTDFALSTMGFATVDLNRDGVMDYCLSDNHIHCLMSDGQGGFFDTADAVGLGLGTRGEPDENGEWYWSGWSVEVEDFDNDTLPDAMAVAAAPPPIIRDLDHPFAYLWPVQPDQYWAGREGGTFEAASAESGLDDPSDHYSVAAADLDDDGWLDLAVGPWSGRPRLWMNRCGEGHWSRVRLEGAAGNRNGFGARVTLTAGGETWMREVHGLRVAGQRPPTLHFGLGAVDTVDRIEVVWPDGATSVHEGGPAGTELVVGHPAR